MKLLTASRLKLARECAQKERLTYRDGWRPAREGEALQFGTLMHSALEHWWTTRGDLDGAEAVLDASLSADMDLFEFQKAKAILRGYDARWKGDLELYDVLQVEAEFRAPLINPETMHPSRTWRVGGKIDAILRRRADGKVVVREFKTTSEEIATDDESYWLKLAMDSQISFYVLGAESLGFVPDETMYDVVKKPGLRPLMATPEEKRRYTIEKRDKAGNVTKPSQLYASDRDTDETVDEYGARIAEELAAAPERHFRRREIQRLESQIEDALFDFWQATQTMTASHRAPRAVRNSDACFKWGSQCAFWSVCALGSDPANLAHLRRVSNPHPELSQTEGEMNESQNSSAA